MEEHESSILGGECEWCSAFVAERAQVGKEGARCAAERTYAEHTDVLPLQCTFIMVRYWSCG